MKEYFLLIFEETLPFVCFARNKWKKIKSIQAGKVPELKIKEYSTLSFEKLKQRLSEEHDRATKIDEKTTKFTLGLSVSLTILSTASGAIAKMLPGNGINYMIVFLCGIASVFMLIAGIISLGALKTLPKFGYGTMHELRAEKKDVMHLASVLFLQEEINIIRHLRNEAAYQCLRNGFLLLLAALIISIFVRFPVESKRNVSPVSKNVIVEKNIVKKKVMSQVNKSEKAKFEPTADSTCKCNIWD